MNQPVIADKLARGTSNMGKQSMSKHRTIHLAAILLLTVLTDAWFCAPVLAAAPDLSVKLEHRVTVFKSGEGIYQHFMVPALIAANDGTLLAFAEGRIGSRQDDAEIHLVLRASSDRGQTWSDLQIVCAIGGQTVGNIAPVLDRDTGTIWLFFCINNDTIWLTHSLDTGKKWSPPIKMSDTLKRPEHRGFFATGPGHGIQLSQTPHRGRLLVTAYGAQSAVEDNPAGSKSFMIISDDHGQNWHMSNATCSKEPKLADDGGECMVTEMSNGDLYMTSRNNLATGKRCEAISHDGGEHWDLMQLQEQLPEPVCEASVLSITLPDDGGDILLFLAPSHAATERMDKSARRDLMLWVSRDNARNWTQLYQLNEGPGSYTDMCQLDDGTLGCFWNGNEEGWFADLTFDRYRITTTP